MNKLNLDVPDSFISHIDEVIIRLGYMHPDLEIIKEHQKIIIMGEEIDRLTIKKEVMYALYREKIYHETSPIRKYLYG